MAYNFKWSKAEIMDMTKKERLEWMNELNSIIVGEKKAQASFLQNDLLKILDTNKEKAKK